MNHLEAAAPQAGGEDHWVLELTPRGVSLKR
jgi:hypothetical protein